MLLPHLAIDRNQSIANQEFVRLKRRAAYYNLLYHKDSATIAIKGNADPPPPLGGPLCAPRSSSIAFSSPLLRAQKWAVCVAVRDTAVLGARGALTGRSDGGVAVCFAGVAVRRLVHHVRSAHCNSGAALKVDEFPFQPIARIVLLPARERAVDLKINH